MKQIEFKKLIIKNFLSIGDEGIELTFTPGLHIITGVNKDKEDSKNGVGKSTISDALFFAMFGTPLRDIKVEHIANWKTQKTCCVSLEFDVIENYIRTNYKVIRSLDPSRVELLENGENISRTVSKTNSMLKKILGSTPEMIEQSVIMSINQTEPFLKKTPTIKRKFIEGIFKIDVFSEILLIIRHDLNETKRQYNLEKARIDEIQKNLILYKKQQIEYRSKKEARLNELEQRRTNNAVEIQNLNKQIINVDSGEKANLEQKITNVKQKDVKNEVQIKKLLQDNSILQSNIVSSKEKLDDLIQIGDEVCPTCKRVFVENDKIQFADKKSQYQINIDFLNQQIMKLNNDILEVEKIRQQNRKDIDNLVKQIHEIELQQNEIENIKHRIIQSGEWNKQIEIDINTLKTETDTFIELINETQKRLEILNQKINNINNTLEVLNVSKFVVSEEGVRSFIVKKMLKMLNSRLNFYLKSLDANCICTFNEYFEENICNEKGKVVSYFNFSGGERKRIDLAMLFTFLDIRRLQSNVQMNISIYDELLDTSIDSKGIECVLDIFKERINLYNEAVFIISHKNEAIKHATGEIIYLEKQNDITRRIQDGSTV